jgi:ribosomal protein S18 acetylase RimI-like enzyme
MRLETIAEDSPYFDDVIRLWKEHRKTLGLLPRGAFAERAHDRQLIVALDSSDQCVGYLVFRVARDRAYIIHFCVSSSVRKTGYAKALLTHLVGVTAHLRGISLDCRRDYYAASKAWARLGFSPISERQGRATDGSELVRWHLAHPHRQLFQDSIEPDKLTVAIDTNVFIHLVEGTDEEMQGLAADWLQSHISLAVTSEVSVDVNRNSDIATRRKRNIQLQAYPLLEYPHSEYFRLEALLRAKLPVPNGDQDESDFRHVVKAIAGGADILATGDSKLLGVAETLSNEFGLSVIRPGEIITRIDTLQHEKEYQRKYIAGTKLVSRERIRNADKALIESIAFVGERHHVVQTELNRYLADPNKFECHKVTNETGLLALYAVEQTTEGRRVPFLRICARSQSGTVARAILTSLLRHCATDGQIAIRVCEPIEVVADACEALGFVKVGSDWLKPVLKGWITTTEAAKQLITFGDSLNAVCANLEASKSDSVIGAATEHVISPAKLSDAALPCAIVPIRSRFAEHLFDEGLAERGLFGADVSLALNSESVYYRAAHPEIVNCPSRVLWYVSHDEKYQGSKAIRACSRVVERVIDIPSRLFARFKRLGVYDWRDLQETAGGDESKPIMAFRFDDTELLRPIGFEKVQEILIANGLKRNQFQSPLLISPHVFGQIYAAAFDPPDIRRIDPVGSQNSRVETAQAAS